MPRLHVDCAGITSIAEFWQRYVDAAQPQDAHLFGRNLDAFWDALEGGGPGFPGEVTLVFLNAAALAPLCLSNGGSLLADLRAIAGEVPEGRIEFL